MRLRISGIFVALAMVLAACGTDVPSGALTELGDNEDELNLIIWAGYAEDGSNYPEFDWVTPFEEDTGCQVNTTVGNDSAHMVDLMQTGQYDGGSFSGDATVRLMAGEDVAPINVDLIPNYADVFAALKGLEHNTIDGVPYGTPHGRGANILLYNTEFFDEAPTSWDAMWDSDSPAAGKISVYDGSIYIADAALHLMATEPDLGITDPYQLNDEQFQAAVDLLMVQNEIVGEYWSGAAFTEQITSFSSGDMVIGTSWGYQFSVLSAEPDNVIAVAEPEEGATGWSDTWMISSTAEHPNCMYRWMNHMLSPLANAQATIYFQEAAVTEPACEYADTFEDGLYAGHCETYHATDDAYWEDVYYWTTPREDCGDDDDATTCKDQADWIEAWTEVTGG
jgi:putative spermidine/putrescine transport system substrate-binding protein